MNNNQKFYLNIKNEVLKITEEAVKLVRYSDFDVERKADDASNIVTTNDLKSQRFLCERLSALIPGSRFYCEEEDMKETEGEFIWVIDPIDGTMNYSRGIAECAISVALLHNKRAVVGVVRSIFADEVFSAAEGLGAELNGKAISVSDWNYKNALFCTAMSVYKKELAKVCSDIIYETHMQCNDIRRFGSCAIELCYLAAGKCDLYFEIHVAPWDYAAASVILSEAGGILTGYNGEPLTFDKHTPLIGANNKENHTRLNATVVKHMETL